MKNILNMIEEIESFIFDFNIKSAMNNIAELIEKLILISSSLDELELQRLSNILYYMNMALENKDYLLYADILEFELKAFIKNQC